MPLNPLGLVTVAGGVFLLCFITETLWNIINGVRAHVLPRFKDKKSVDLTDKYGTWAGKSSLISIKLDSKN